MKTILRVWYKNKETGDIYSRDYEYRGRTYGIGCLEDCDKYAYGKAKENEDVMSYKIIYGEI